MRLVKIAQFFLCLILLSGLFSLGVAVRRHVLNAQMEQLEGDLPFTLESAVGFRRIQQVYRNGALPVVDRGMEFPDGIQPRQTDTVGAEKAYVVFAKAWPGVKWSLTEKVRWGHTLWFCTGILFLFFWVKWMGGGAIGGTVAAAFYAVCIASVIRSTGQELSHENNALPLLLAHLALWVRAKGAARNSWTYAVLMVASFVLLALSQCAWDLIQFYVFFWILFSGVQLLWERDEIQRRPAIKELFVLLIILSVTGVWNPYLRAHGFVLSPALCMGWGFCLAGLVRSPKAGLTTLRWLIPIALVLAGLCLSRAYQPSYSHFSSLLWAKLRFLNVRPLDPARLTFEQRILWTPSLHSTTWRLFWNWFPGIFLLTLPAISGLLVAVKKTDFRPAGFFPLLSIWFISLLSFILFFRFHVWLILFSVAIVGLWAGWTVKRLRWLTLPVLLLCVLVFVVELRHTWLAPQRWGRPNVYYAEGEALTEWLRRNVAPEPVLANFGTSGLIVAYGGCPVVLHPKFESPKTRAWVKEYAKNLFTGTESDFRRWMDGKGVTLYVHSLGEFSRIQPEYQMRYMVNAMNPPPDAPARMFEENPAALTEFECLWENRKYRVFRSRSPLNAERAADWLGRASRAFAAGRLEEAEVSASRALALEPDNAEAQIVLQRIMGLWEQGFEYEDALLDIESEPVFAPFE